MKMNLEETVQWLTEVAESGIKPEKWLLFSELPTYVTSANLGKYYIVSKDDKELLYYITKRNNDGLMAIDLGEWPRKGEQGIAGEKGDSPVITISENSTWVIDGVDTGKPTRGEQGERGYQGIVGRSGAGLGSITEFTNEDYLCTSTTGETYTTYSTSADLKFYVGEDLRTDTMDVTFKVPVSGGGGGGTTLYRHIIELFTAGGDDPCFFTNFVWVNTRSTPYADMDDIFNDPDICNKMIPAYCLDEWGAGSMLPSSDISCSRIGTQIKFLDTEAIECQCFTERMEAFTTRAESTWEPYVSSDGYLSSIDVTDTVTALT